MVLLLCITQVKRFAHSIGLNGASEAEHDVTILANSTTHPKADVGASENLKQASFITPPKQTEIESNHDMVVESGNRKVSKGIRDHENQLMGYQPLPVKKMLFNFEVSGSWHEEVSKHHQLVVWCHVCLAVVKLSSSCLHVCMLVLLFWL